MPNIRLPAVLHVVLAGLALTIVVRARRAMPRAWTWFTLAYVLPSLALGIVGVGRYATDTFPPYVAAATLLERRRSSTRALVFIALVVTQACLAFVFIADGHLI